MPFRAQGQAQKIMINYCASWSILLITCFACSFFALKMHRMSQSTPFFAHDHRRWSKKGHGQARSRPTPHHFISSVLLVPLWGKRASTTVDAQVAQVKIHWKCVLLCIFCAPCPSGHRGKHNKKKMHIKSLALYLHVVHKRCTPFRLHGVAVKSKIVPLCFLCLFCLSLWPLQLPCNKVLEVAMVKETSKTKGQCKKRSSKKKQASGQHNGYQGYRSQGRACLQAKQKLLLH